MVSVADALAQATRHYQSGQLAEAERLYRQVLAIEPSNADALHLLGNLAMQAGRYDAAVEMIGEAIRHDRKQAAFYANLGEAYRMLKQDAQAVENYRKALHLQPSQPRVRAMLGAALTRLGQLDEALAALREAVRLLPDDNRARARLGQVLQLLGKPGEAELCFRRVLRSAGNSAEAHFNLGTVLQDQQKLEEAVACYATALQLDPAHADTHHNLGMIRQRQRAFEEADAHFRAVLAARPAAAPALLNLGASCWEQDRLAEAAGYFRQALAVDPAHAASHAALGSVLLRQCQGAEALACFREALRLGQLDAATHINVAAALKLLGRLNEAVESLHEAARIEPGNANVYNNLSAIFNEQGQRDQALEMGRRAIALQPEYAQPYNNLAIALMSLGRMDEAIPAARRAAEMRAATPAQQSSHHSNLLYMLNYSPTFDGQRVFEEHRDWGRRFVDPLMAAAAPHVVDRTPARRLRVGYVSAHFVAHAVNFFVEPILASHDHQQFDITCYANVPRSDETTQRLRGFADQWRDIVGLTDNEASRLVRDDQIDILVDLSGHIDGNRLGIFAQKPAPIQVTYIGYQATTGMAAIDYRLTDAWADPPSKTGEWHTEKLVRLSRSFFCYLPSVDAPPVASLPALARGHVTFGSFNAFAKVTPRVLAVWAQLLLRVPGSRLIVLANAEASLREYLETTIAGHGVDLARLTLADRRPRRDYLELMGQVDIALDPFPFNGHTTTCDALWQGVPVVTLAGDRYVSRFGSSAHMVLGLPELIASSEDEYVQIAAGLAGDLARLQELRGTLRERFAASPLVDYVGFTRNLETAYREMWRDWCQRTGADKP